MILKVSIRLEKPNGVFVCSHLAICRCSVHIHFGCGYCIRWSWIVLIRNRKNWRHKNELKINCQAWRWDWQSLVDTVIDCWIHAISQRIEAVKYRRQYCSVLPQLHTNQNHYYCRFLSGFMEIYQPIFMVLSTWSLGTIQLVKHSLLLRSVLHGRSQRSAWGSSAHPTEISQAQRAPPMISKWNALSISVRFSSKNFIYPIDHNN